MQLLRPNRLRCLCSCSRDHLCCRDPADSRLQRLSRYRILARQRGRQVGTCVRIWQCLLGDLTDSSNSSTSGIMISKKDNWGGAHPKKPYDCNLVLPGHLRRILMQKRYRSIVLFACSHVPVRTLIVP